jgi:hypothetical protein
MTIPERPSTNLQIDLFHMRLLLLHTAQTQSHSYCQSEAASLVRHGANLADNQFPSRAVVCMKRKHNPSALSSSSSASCAASLQLALPHQPSQAAPLAIARPGAPLAWPHSRALQEVAGHLDAYLIPDVTNIVLHYLPQGTLYV